MSDDTEVLVEAEARVEEAYQLFVRLERMLRRADAGQIARICRLQRRAIDRHNRRLDYLETITEE